MKTPKRIEPLIEDGLVDEVLRPLMSGKEAAVYVVRCGSEVRCAKVYKEANKRSFRQAAEYQEGRKVRNSRQARAMAKGSKFGRKETEDAWQNAEVAALFRLAAAGVRVPKPYDFQDGVLLMELVTDADGDAAPRVVAKGNGLIAQEIIDRARAAGVYVHESRELVALLMRVDLDQNIPPQLYIAIAELLAWLYKLEQGGQDSPPPELPGDIVQQAAQL